PRAFDQRDGVAVGGEEVVVELVEPDLLPSQRSTRRPANQEARGQPARLVLALVDRDAVATLSQPQRRGQPQHSRAKHRDLPPHAPRLLLEMNVPPPCTYRQQHIILTLSRRPASYSAERSGSSCMSAAW